MANTPPKAGARAPHRPYLNGAQRPLSWIKRRARRIEHRFQVSRREALSCALHDWHAFNPNAMH